MLKAAGPPGGFDPPTTPVSFCIFILLRRIRYKVQGRFIRFVFRFLSITIGYFSARVPFIPSQNEQEDRFALSKAAKSYIIALSFIGPYWEDVQRPLHIATSLER